MQADPILRQRNQIIFKIPDDIPFESDPVKSLQNRACLRVWRSVYELLAHKRTPTTHERQALSVIPHHAEEALRTFKTDKCYREIMQERGSLSLYVNIIDKFKVLAKFNNIVPGSNSSNHQFYTSFDAFQKETWSRVDIDETAREISLSSRDQSGRHVVSDCKKFLEPRPGLSEQLSELTSFFCAQRQFIEMGGTIAFTFSSTLFFFIWAWPRFKKERGSKDEADYWLLQLPIMLMQIHNLIVSGLESLWKRPGKRHVPVWPKLFIWGLAACTLAFALAAPGVFGRWSQRYGQLLSQLATVGQAWMVLALTAYKHEELRDE